MTQCKQLISLLTQKYSTSHEINMYLENMTCTSQSLGVRVHSLGFARRISIKGARNLPQVVVGKKAHYEDNMSWKLQMGRPQVTAHRSSVHRPSIAVELRCHLSRRFLLCVTPTKPVKVKGGKRKQAKNNKDQREAFVKGPYT